MTRRSLTFQAVLAISLAGAVALAGCGSSSTTGAATSTTAAPATTAAGSGSATTASSGAGGSTTVQGITSTTITLGELADVGGPDPGLFTGAVDGMDAWAAEVNAAGGIDGRKIVVEHKDSALSCTSYTNGMRSFIGSTFATVGTYSLVDACGESMLKADPTFPDIQGSVFTPAMAALPNVFGVVPATSGYATTGYQWVKDTFGLAAVQHTAVLYSQEASASFYEQKAAASTIGYKYLYFRGVGPTETNFTSDVLRMKSENVKVIDLTGFDAQDLANFLQEAAQQGFHPLAVVNTTGYDPTFFKLVGKVSAANILVLPLPYAMFLGEDAATVPEIGTFTSWMNKTHPGDPLNLFALDGFASGLLFQQAMAAVGPDPTQAKLIAAVDNITDFTADGLLSPANVGQKKGQTCVVIARAENGKFVRTDPKTGFECNGTFVYSTGS